MAKTTPQQAAADWASRLAASTDKIQRGIQSVTVAPGQAAARQVDVWAANVAQSKPKFARNVAAVSLQAWQADAINKGLPRIASGAQAAQPKMEAFMSRLLPYVDQQVAALGPRGTLDQNIARMDKFVRGMAAFK